MRGNLVVSTPPQSSPIEGEDKDLAIFIVLGDVAVRKYSLRKEETRDDEGRYR